MGGRLLSGIVAANTVWGVEHYKSLRDEPLPQRALSGGAAGSLDHLRDDWVGGERATPLSSHVSLSILALPFIDSKV